MGKKKNIRTAASDYLAKIGSRGGKAGSRADKVKAAQARWAKSKPQSDTSNH